MAASATVVWMLSSSNNMATSIRLALMSLSAGSMMLKMTVFDLVEMPVMTSLLLRPACTL